MHLLRPGQHLAGYEIVGFVAKGGMGEVYRARQVAMERVVALKILSPHLAKRDPAFVRRFVAEARAAGRLNHANIVRVHDVDRAQLETPQGPLDVDFFAMEFVEGETVKDVIAEYSMCPQRLIAKVMHGMAEALVYAQHQGLVHRDIKPENVMLSRDGEIKLADLGLALQSGSDESIGGDGASSKKVVGTPAYMSPEQASARPVDHRSDQYSLGATLYHMLTGQPPYGMGESRAVMRAHVFDPVPDPQAVRPDAPEGWCRLCRRMLAKNPDERFPDAEALRAAVAAVSEGQRIAGDGSPLPPRAVPWRWIGAVAGIVAVLGATAWLAPRIVGESAPAPLAAEDRIAAALAAVPPGDAAARLALIDRLAADPANTSATALLARLRSDCLTVLAQDDAARRAQTVAEAERRRGEERLAAIRSDLAAGHLAAARRGLASLGTMPPALNAAVGDVQNACVRLSRERREHLAARIAQADEVALVELDGAVAGSELEDAERASLGALLATRRAQVQQQARVRAAERVIEAWRSVAQAWETRRGEAFLPLDVASPWRSQLDSDDRRLALDLLGSASLALPRIEAALARWIAANRPEVDLIAEGRWSRVRLLRWEATQVQMQEPTGEPRNVSRRRVSMVLAPLVARALAQARAEGNDVGDSPRALALYLWCCRAVDAARVMAQQNDDAALALVTASERLLARPPFALALGPTLQSDGGLARGAAWHYGGGQAWSALSADFTGLPVQMTDDAWRLQVTTPVPRPVVEKNLPTWAWRGHVHGPVVLTARLRLPSETPSVLVGFRSASGYALCVGVRPCDHSVGWLRTAPAALVAAGTMPWTAHPDHVVTLRLALDAAGGASASVDGQVLSPEKPFGMPSDKLTPMLQIITDDKHPSATVEVLSLGIEGGP